MKPHPGRYAAIVLPLWFAVHPAGAIEIKGGAATVARPAGAVTTSTAAGVVTAVDGRSGTLVLDGTRRFAFDPAALVVRRQSNAGSPARLADVSVGARVSLTLVSGSVKVAAKGSAKATVSVSEVWIAR